jgi:hypothetical protein
MRAERRLLMCAAVCVLTLICVTGRAEDGNTKRDCPEHDKLIATYAEVLQGGRESTKSAESTYKAAIENIQETTKLVLWLVAGAFALLTFEGLGVASCVAWATRRAYGLLRKADSAHEEAQAKVRGLEATIATIDQQVARVAADARWLTETMNVMQVAREGPRLFDTNASTVEDALNSLAAQMKSNEPVVKWLATLVLQLWRTNPSVVAPDIAGRVAKILESSTVAGRSQ